MCKKLYFFISFALVVGLAASSQAAVIYYDNFDGSSADLDNTTPDITKDGAVWDAGAWVNANGTYGGGSSGQMFTAALPFTPTVGAAYELSATGIDNPGDDVSSGDFIGIAFLNTTTPTVTTRINDNSPVLWSLTRPTSSANKDQALIGPGSNNLVGNSTTKSAADLKVRIEMNSTTEWLVKWYFNGSLQFQRVIDPTTYSITINYVAFGSNGLFRACTGTISSFKLEEIPQALKPNPANNSLIYSTNVSLQWQPGIYAAYHDVYFGGSFADVNNATTSTPIIYKGRQDPNNYSTTSLTQGATYYWRIDEVRADGTTIDRGEVWNFKVQPLIAYNPSPPEGAKYMATDVNLAWSPGAKAKKHDVYLGTSFNNVNNATTANPLGVLLKQNHDANTYDPGTLALGTTYYWRIDEVNTPNVWKGDVWSFETMPSIPITDPDLMGWWKFDEDWGTKALDWSGHGNHGTLINGPQWAAGHIDGALQFDGGNDQVSLPIGPVISSLSSSTFTTWVNWARIGATMQRIFDIGTGTTAYMFLTPGNGGGGGAIQFNITTPGGTGTLTASSSLAAGWHHMAVVTNGVSQTMQLYVDGVIVASGSTTILPSALGNTTNNWLGRSQAGDYTWFTGFLDDFRIYKRALTQTDIGKFVFPPEAWLPNPANGATDVEPTLTLVSWNPGVRAVKHDVYLSSNFDDVNSATTLSPPTIYRGRQDPNKYDITTELNWGDTYYWRIDEVNDPNIWRGNIWSFTVRNFLVVDDFESYTNSDPNIIFKIWKDGVGYSPGNGTGSQVGYRDPNYAEVTIVNGGAQSMPVDYNNTKTPYYSEAIRTFDTPQNWTVSGSSSLKALSLWFRGYPVSVGSFVENPAGTYTINASGADIWDVPDLRHPSRFHDEFHYAYKEVTAADEEEGLVTIVARVESITNTNAWAKAGVMIRHSLDPNSTHGIMCVSPTSGVAFQRRPETGGASSSTATTGITAPYWVKIVLDPVFGNLRAYHSPTGNTDEWTQMGDTQQITNMTLPVYVGLAVTSHNTAATCTAVFSNVTITVGAAGAWKHQDIGIKSNVASPLYVTLQDSKTPTPGTKTITHSDPNILLQNTWQVWDIPLSDFTGVDPTKIKKITIGVGSGSADGTGTIYIDDIRLYVPRCAPDQLRSAADFTGSDCTVDYQDLAILTDNWTISNWLVTPPVGWNPDSDPNLAAYYAFNGNFNDTSGKGHNGEPNGATIVTDSTRGQVANFDGSNDYVVLPTIGSVIGSLNSITIATWVNFSNTGGAWQRIFDFGTGTTVYMFLTPRLDTAGAMRFAITVNGGDATAEQRVTAPSTLASGWHHVAVTINAANDTIRLYLDGLLVAENTAATLTPSDLGNTTNNWLGRSQYAADGYLSGRLDDFRIYSRALSQGEVAYLAGKTTPFTQPLYLLLTPQNSAINLYNDGTIDLRDYALLADTWLEILLWP